jgi:hypothetical protein
VGVHFTVIHEDLIETVNKQVLMLFREKIENLTMYIKMINPEKSVDEIDRFIKIILYNHVENGEFSVFDLSSQFDYGILKADVWKSIKAKIDPILIDLETIRNEIQIVLGVEPYWDYCLDFAFYFEDIHQLSDKAKQIESKLSFEVTDINGEAVFYVGYENIISFLGESLFDNALQDFLNSEYIKTSLPRSFDKKEVLKWIFEYSRTRNLYSFFIFSETSDDDTIRFAEERISILVKLLSDLIDDFCQKTNIKLLFGLDYDADEIYFELCFDDMVEYTSGARKIISSGKSIRMGFH